MPKLNLRPWIFPALLFLALLGQIDTAQAQTVSVSPSSTVTFNAQANSALPQQQSVTVLFNSSPVSNLTLQVPVYVSAPPGVPPASVNWLSDSLGAGPGTILFTANTQTLIPGTYSATVTVNGTGISATTITVNLTVFSTTNFTTDQTSLTFMAQANGATPAAQTINVSTPSSPGVGFTATATVSTPVGGTWLSVTPASANTGTTPTPLTVTVNPAGLGAGTYSGTITLTSQASSLNLQPVMIPVTLVVSGQAVVSANPTTVNLLYQSGVNAPAPTQSIQIISTSGTISYTATVAYSTSNTCGNFLNVTSGQTGTASPNVPATLAIMAANLTTLPAGTCNATITVNTQGQNTANPQLTIPVVLTVSPNAQISAYPGSLTFTYAVGSAAPTQQSITLTTSNNVALNYTVNAVNAPWLALPANPSPNGFSTGTSNVVPININVNAIPPPGTYTGSIVIQPVVGSAVTVPVTLTVSNNPLFIITPSFLNFNYQLGFAPPPAQSFNIATSFGSLPFALTAPSTTGVSFFSVTPGIGTATTTPTAISVVPVGIFSSIAAGTYSFPIAVSGTGTAANVPAQTVTVTLTVSTTPLVNISPQAIVFPDYVQGATLPNPVTISLTSTDGTSALPVQIAANQSWILLSPLSNSSNTPSSFQVSISPTGLVLGNNSGVVTVTSGGATQQIAVNVLVTSPVALSVAPTSLSFTQAAGGTVPAVQTLTVNTSIAQAVSFSANATTTNGNASWLLINGSTQTVQGTAVQALTISVNGAGLSPGTYNGTVTITSLTASNPAILVPVTLTITAAQSLAVSPASLTFMGAAGSAAPASQTIAVTSTTGSPVAYTTVAQAQGGNWLSVTPTSGTTPGSVTVTANQTGLAMGSYMGTVTLTPTASGSTPLVVNVMLTVGTQQTPAVVTIINAASGGTGSVAPGEIVSLFGTGLGPVTAVGTMLTAAGNVSTNIGNTQVFFDGIAAPLTYVSAGQINAVVPYEVAGKTITQVTLNFNGLTSAAMPVAVGATSPGIFTINNSGSGPGAVLNQNASVNASGNPATRGSVIVIFATGEGQTNAPGVTGSVIGSNVKFPVAPVTVTIGGQPATIQYAGSAPGDVSGVFQLNVTVPAGVTPGASVPVVVQVGTVSSQANVTIAVQ